MTTSTTGSRACLAALAWVAVIVLGVIAYQRLAPAAEAAMTQRASVTEIPVDLAVTRLADLEKPGSLRSVMGQLEFRQAPRTTGTSPDTLRFRFDAPVRIVGVLVSVDILHLDLVEVGVGVNQTSPYGLQARDWLIHTSDAGGGAGSKIDEQSWFGDRGFVVGPEDFVGVGAWLWNGDTQEWSVSPEVILYYEWLE